MTDSVQGPIKGYTLADALLGGPGLDGYAFNADVYCVPCGQAIARER
jgi:hypothetical protein